MSNPVVPPRWRDYLYPVTLAVAALLGGYGILDDEQIALWGALGAAVLGTGTATAYRPSRTVPEGDGRHRADTNA